VGASLIYEKQSYWERPFSGPITTIATITAVRTIPTRIFLADLAHRSFAYLEVEKKPISGIRLLAFGSLQIDTRTSENQ
jgi:hypothetical protein